MGKPYPGVYTFDRHPWARAWHDSKYPSNVIQKGAQCGATEAVLNIVFFTIDVKGENVLYILPNTKPDASDFSSSRFDPALELSEHLQDMFSNVQNVGHKRAGAANLFIRGSNSRSQLKSIPASLLVFDEIEEMDKDNVELAMERMSGQLARFDFKVSTPQIPNGGINYYFNKSTKDQFFFRCPSCSKFINLHFDPTNKTQNNLIITGEHEHDPKINNSHLQCHECKNKLPNEDKIIFLKDGVWQAELPDRDARGFYINQLYGMNEPQSPPVIAKAYLASLSSMTTEQEFWNSKMGLAKVPKDSQITQEHIEQCMTNQRQIDFRPDENIITLGCDVGKALHVVVKSWQLNGRKGNDVNTYALARNIFHSTVYDFSDLDRLMHMFQINFAVVDAQPETREALRFANRFMGRVRVCRYSNGVMGRQLVEGSDEELSVNVDRTSWLDTTLGRYRNKTVLLPVDTRLEFKSQIKAQVRMVKMDKNNNPVSRYITPGDIPDHYAHADNYAEIALPLALGIGFSTDYKD